MLITLNVAVSDGLPRPVRLPQEITLAAITVMRAQSMTTSFTFMLTFSGMPPPGPMALLEAAVIILKLRNVKNMSVVLETTLVMLQTSGATLAVYRYNGRLTAVVNLDLAVAVGLSGGTNGAKPLVPMQKNLMTIMNSMTVTPSTASVLLICVLTPALYIKSAAKNVMMMTGVKLKPNDLTATPAPTP